MSQAKAVFQYIFCVTNSLQGLFIFLLHVVKSKHSRLLWSRVFCCGGADENKDKNSTSLSEFSSDRNRTVKMTIEHSPPSKKKNLTGSDDNRKLSVTKPEHERKVSTSSMMELLNDDSRFDSTSTLVSNLDAPATEKRHIMNGNEGTDDMSYHSTDQRPAYFNSENDIKLILPED